MQEESRQEDGKEEGRQEATEDQRDGTEEAVSFLDELKKTYEYHSGKASDIGRHLGFAGIALIWMFKVGVGSKVTVPPELYLPAVLIVAGLATDLLQYAGQALVYWRYYRWAEGKIDESPVVDSPSWIQAVFWAPWLLKLGCIVAAYCFLLSFLWAKFVSSVPP